ncbi:MarR family transcriptional regulator [Rhodobacterales bacterium HKCCE2091]|nr:MarR family transcriptional regulator [Rhodobacterales bacterium HKCCE2091]
MPTNLHAQMEERDRVETGTLDNKVSYLVRLIQIASYKQFEAVNLDCGTAPRYFGMLKLVELNPGISQNVLSRAIALDRSSLVPIVEKMESEGILERRPSEADQRLKCLFLTDRGAEVVQLLEERAQEHEAVLTAGLTDIESSILVSMLQRVAANLRG